MSERPHQEAAAHFVGWRRRREMISCRERIAEARYRARRKPVAPLQQEDRIERSELAALV